MVALIIGSFLLALSLGFLIRGWIFTLKPDHKLSAKIKERNMRLGLETDMRVWGRRTRRIGFILFVTGGLLAAWGAGLFGS